MVRSIPSDRLDGLPAPDSGLSAAAERRARYGANAIVEAPPGGWIDVVRDSLRDPMLWSLLGTSALFAFVGDRTEAAILLAALVPLFGMDAWLHRRTQASLAGLSSGLAATARVPREGAWTGVPAVDLIPGDVVALASGDSVPAEGVLLHARDVQVGGLALTGESFPVRKARAPQPLAGGVRLDDRHWSLAGTRVAEQSRGRRRRAHRPLTPESNFRPTPVRAAGAAGRPAASTEGGPRDERVERDADEDVERERDP